MLAANSLASKGPTVVLHDWTFPYGSYCIVYAVAAPLPASTTVATCAGSVPAPVKAIAPGARVGITRPFDSYVAQFPAEVALEKYDR